MGGTGLICPATGAVRKSSPAGRTGGLHGTTTDLNHVSVQPTMYQEGQNSELNAEDPNSGDPHKSKKMDNT